MNPLASTIGPCCMIVASTSSLLCMCRLPVGSNTVKAQMAFLGTTTGVSSLRPVVCFRYEAAPQMFFERAEYMRVSAAVTTDDDHVVTVSDDDEPVLVGNE